MAAAAAVSLKISKHISMTIIGKIIISVATYPTASPMPTVLLCIPTAGQPENRYGFHNMTKSRVCR